MHMSTGIPRGQAGELELVTGACKTLAHCQSPILVAWKSSVSSYLPSHLSSSLSQQSNDSRILSLFLTQFMHEK